MRQFTESFYLGEHLFYGHLGHFLIIAAFISAAFSFGLGLRYFLSKNKTEADLTLARQFFYVHFGSILGIFFLLIFLFKAQYFEYHYIWRHSSRELPWYYILSAMWEGQEGSFILWILWHSILGFILWLKPTENKIGAVSILMLIQVLLLTMILGVDIGGKLIGMNPFILLRQEMQIPILSNPNYLSLIKDGNGLNILLQNYWMVIHPPVLFLGFAATSIPFCFALASLLKRDFTTWTKDVATWSLLALAVLGAGILMGGRWAYEALSFGGFWAWDPVENASLVPWLFLLAGLHTLLIYRATGHSLKATYLLFTLAFGFILYSTFLTRSGILGDTSVHSFTDLGMTGQLLIFMIILLLPAFLFLAFYWSQIPDIKQEEKTSSREFWMFMGVLFVVVSALQITFTMSIPVWNKLFDFKEKLAPPLNANEHYNSIQIWFATVVCFLMAASLWLMYKATTQKAIYKRLGIVLVISFIVAAVHLYLCKIEPFQAYIIEIKDYKITLKFLSTYLLLFTSAVALIIASIWYLIQTLRNSDKLYWGGSIAHIGFGILILGALVSQYQKKAISLNKAGIDLGKEFNMDEQSSNTLLVKQQWEEMGKYKVRYTGKSAIFKGEEYAVNFVNKNNLGDSFTIYPQGKIIKEGDNNRLNPEPGIAHFWNKDIFSHVSSVPDFSETKGKATTKKMKLHDTFYTGNKMVVLDRVMSQQTANNILNVKAKLLVQNMEGYNDSLFVPFVLNTITGEINNPLAFSRDSFLRINLIQISPENQEFHFSVVDNETVNEWIILKVIEFPHIQILWLGCIVMTIGTLMSMQYRRRKNKG